jgi:molybdate transport system substrate-binding protein
MWDATQFSDGGIIMKHYLLTSIALLLATVCAGCQLSDAFSSDRRLVVHSPPVLVEAMAQITPLFEARHPGVRVRLITTPIRPDLAATLNGKDGDVIVASGKTEASLLRREEIVQTDGAAMFGGLEIVVLARKGNPKHILKLADITKSSVKRIAIPDPEYNSAGVAFFEAMTRMKLFEQVEDRLLLTRSPAQASQMLLNGKADVCITYAQSYRRQSGKSALITALPTEKYAPINCRAMVMESVASSALAEVYVAFLNSPRAKKKIEAAGFPIRPLQQAEDCGCD